MIRKVIYIGYQPLTVKVQQDFYFSKVIESGLEVEYWDLSNIYFPNILVDHLDEEYIIKVNDFKELELRLINQKKIDCLYVLHITYEYRVIKLFSLLTKYNCKISFFARGALPVSGDITPLRIKILKALNPIVLCNFIKNRYAGFQKKRKKIKCYDFVFSAGELGWLSIGCGANIDKMNSKVINVNSHDYDAFIEANNFKNIIGNKYCLFLDEYLPHHPDYKLIGMETIDSFLYYTGINDFFDFIEEKFKIEVVIAAHPKAKNYTIENPFNGRKIIFNETARLTKFSEFTIAHLSTSQSFSILNDKPIISLTSNILKKIMPQRDRFISFFSQTLGSSYINLDEFALEDINCSTVNIQKYENYKYKYLTSKESETKITSDVFIKTITE
ncbi:hypothetical protein LPB87_04565 [Flavobacterium sp. EDS]|uniref:hypothetical protein n=1 Tax=Flavobacterium sp. EDS TaxID=2897328 RepID=UPI001E37F84C|nr:hypothetical protein [Flavobacterium sp. EDS]MCD0473664.1 hypothetical protein [Flavobacterium sp. EDS]